MSLLVLITGIVGLAICSAYYFLDYFKQLGVLLFVALILQGGLQFFWNFEQAFWAPYGLAAISCLRLIMDATISRKKYMLKGIGAAIGAVVTVFCISALFNNTSVVGAIGVSKNYFLFWVVVPMVMNVQSDEHLMRLWKLVLFIALLQFPICFLQGIMYPDNWDAMTGTFGGDPFGGAHSGGMAFFIVTCMCVIFSLYLSRIAPLYFFLIYVISVLATIAIGEVKVAFVWILIAASYVMLRYFKSRPKLVIVAASTSIVALLFIATIYDQKYENTEGLSSAADYELVDDWFNPETGEVSRKGAIVRWWEANDPSSLEFYLGHGPSASRVSQTLGDGDLVSKYYFNLSTSTVSVLLWEIGVVGLVVFFLPFLMAWNVTGFFMKSKNITLFEKGCGIGFKSFIILIPSLMLYNFDLLDAPAVQFYVSFVIASIARVGNNVLNRDGVSA